MMRPLIVTLVIIAIVSSCALTIVNKGLNKAMKTMEMSMVVRR